MALHVLKLLRPLASLSNCPRMLSTYNCVCYRNTSPFLQRFLKLTSLPIGRFCNSRRAFSDTHKVVADDSKESSEEQKKREASWRTMKYGFIAFGASFGILGIYMFIELGGPQKDENGQVIVDEFYDMPLVKQYFCRMFSQLDYFKRAIREPSNKKLLPDPLKFPYIQPRYTLVLELRDVLVHPDWTYKTGWRFKKRPGVDKFLEAVGMPKFETVVYTAEQGMTVFPILDALDPNGNIMYRLVRDATHFVNGHHVKDLDCLNRDLSKVIVVDWDKNAVMFHPTNALIIKRWMGNDDDHTLTDLAAFLTTIASENVEDVRVVLEYYQQFDDPLAAFRENQRKVLEQIHQEQKDKEQAKSQILTKGWTPSFLHK